VLPRRAAVAVHGIHERRPLRRQLVRGLIGHLRDQYTPAIASCAHGAADAAMMRACGCLPRRMHTRGPGRAVRPTALLLLRRQARVRGACCPRAPAAAPCSCPAAPAPQRLPHQGVWRVGGAGQRAHAVHQKQPGVSRQAAADERAVGMQPAHQALKLLVPRPCMQRSGAVSCAARATRRLPSSWRPPSHANSLLTVSQLQQRLHAPAQRSPADVATS
jgi:hypothetical protein